MTSGEKWELKCKLSSGIEKAIKLALESSDGYAELKYIVDFCFYYLDDEIIKVFNEIETTD